MSDKRGKGAAPRERKDRRSAYEMAARLLELVDDVRAAGTKLTVQTIMQRYRVQRATAGRYRQFVERHLSVVPGLRGGRRVVAPKTDREGLFMRAAALAVAAGTLSCMRETELHKALKSMAAQARSELDEADRQVLDGFYGRIYVKRRESRRRQQYAEVVDRIGSAARDRRRCKLHDYTKLDGTTKDYLVEPLSLMVMGESSFLYARKLPEEEARSFEINQVMQCSLTDEVFVPPPPMEIDPERAFRDSVGTYESLHQDPVEVVLRVRDRARVLLDRRPLHSSQHLEAAAADGWAIARLRVIVCPELRSEILSMLPDVVVVQPATLRDDVRSAALSANGSDWDP